MNVKAVRGAIDLNENSAAEVERASKTLLLEILTRNKIEEKNVISIIFSQTADITAKNPAAALRLTGFSDTPLFCTQEPEYEGSKLLMLRVLVTFNTKSINSPFPVYLGNAAELRPDL